MEGLALAVPTQGWEGEGWGQAWLGGGAAVESALDAGSPSVQLRRRAGRAELATVHQWARRPLRPQTPASGSPSYSSQSFLLSVLATGDPPLDALTEGPLLCPSTPVREPWAGQCHCHVQEEAPQ